MMGLQMCLSSALIVFSVVGVDSRTRRQTFGSRPHDIVAVPDLGFVQNPPTEPPVTTRTEVYYDQIAPDNNYKRTRPDQYYDQEYYQTKFVSSPVLTQPQPYYPESPASTFFKPVEKTAVGNVQYGLVNTENQYNNGGSTLLGNYYLQPAQSYHRRQYCNHFYGYLRPCYNWRLVD